MKIEAPKIRPTIISVDKNKNIWKIIIYIDQ